MQRLTQVFLDDKYYNSLYLTNDEHTFLVDQLRTYRKDRNLPAVHPTDRPINVT